VISKKISAMARVNLFGKMAESTMADGFVVSSLEPPGIATPKDKSGKGSGSMVRERPG
jgi:hypothetical protein